MFAAVAGLARVRLRLCESCHKVRNISVIERSIAVHIEHEIGVHSGNNISYIWIRQPKTNESDVNVVEFSIAVGVTQYG